MASDGNDNQGIDLSGKLKERGTGVQFQGEWRPSSPHVSSAKTPKVIQWVMRLSGGFVQSEQQASYVIFGFVVLAIVVSLVLMVGARGGPDIRLPKGAKIIYPPNEPPRLERPLNP